MSEFQSVYILKNVQGTGCEMYTETLSPSFNGMTFVQAAETCFVRVNTDYIDSSGADFNEFELGR